MGRIHPYALLSVSIVLEVFGTTMMKLSVGFTVPLFTVLTLMGYLVSFTLLTFTLKHLPLGLVYGIWGGVGTVLTAAIGIIAPEASSTGSRAWASRSSWAAWCC